MMRVSRLIVADPRLSSPLGHDLGYSQAVAEAAKARGVPALILAGRKFQGDVAGGTISCHPIFGGGDAAGRGMDSLKRSMFGAASWLPSPLAAIVVPPFRTLRRGLRRGLAQDPFGEELARALDWQDADVVLLPSASAANLAGLPAELGVGAICIVLRWTPTEMDRYDRAHQPVGTVLRALVWRFGSRLRLFADTEELAALYARLVNVPVGIVPLPVVVPVAVPRQPHRPPHLVFAGGARPEKGYARLPALIAALRGRARFTIHSGPVDHASDPVLQRAHRVLRRWNGSDLNLIESALAPDAYHALLADSDLILLPYDAASYGPRSSGILAEARALGVPAVVPAGCWMESAAGPAREVVFHGAADFVPTVLRVLCTLPALTVAFREASEEWRRRHSPEALLQTLLR